jgi:hypothetical protein
MFYQNVSLKISFKPSYIKLEKEIYLPLFFISILYLQIIYFDFIKKKALLISSVLSKFRHCNSFILSSFLTFPHDNQNIKGL